MRRWSLRRFLTLCLAVLLAAGMSLSAAQAGTMAMDMAAPSGMAMPGHDCDACPDDDAAAARTCISVCVAPAVALLPQGLAIIKAPTVDAPSPVRRLLPGRALPPDPYPPRATDLS